MNTLRLVVYPRSGTHYLQNLILAYSSQKITLSHYELTENNLIITIARDPFDSIRSFVAMNKHYNPETYKETDYLEYYISLYKYLNLNANIVIDYNDLINFPEKTTEKICHLMRWKKNTLDYSLLENDKTSGYLVSSANVKEYNEEYLKIEDMGRCYDEYYKLLSKKIKI